MSLAEIYNNHFGTEGGQTQTETEKTAEEKQIEQVLSKFSEEDCEKLAAAADLLDAFKVESENGVEKIAQAANVIDYLSRDVEEGEPGGEGEPTGETTKVAENSEELAKEYDAAGRLMARAFHDESQKLATPGEGVAADSFAGRVAAAVK